MRRISSRTTLLGVAIGLLWGWFVAQRGLAFDFPRSLLRREMSLLDTARGLQKVSKRSHARLRPWISFRVLQTSHSTILSRWSTEPPPKPEAQQRSELHKYCNFTVSL